MVGDYFDAKQQYQKNRRIRKNSNSKRYKKILIIATGSLQSVQLANQKLGIPGIAHAVSLEVM